MTKSILGSEDRRKTSYRTVREGLDGWKANLVVEVMSLADDSNRIFGKLLPRGARLREKVIGRILAMKLARCKFAKAGADERPVQHLTHS
jgi:hypothetical protein